ncbi:MAG: hypothetical protein ACOY3P_14360 [Planctomycetota bacterium]
MLPRLLLPVLLVLAAQGAMAGETLHAPTGKPKLLADVQAGGVLIRTDLPKQSQQRWIVTPGTPVVITLAAVVDGKLEVWQWSLAIDDNLPDPHPGPDPQPDPKPDPKPSKLRALWLYEGDDLDDMPTAQSAIITSAAVRDYLEKHCEVDSGLPAFRFLHDDADVSRLPDDWQAVFNHANGQKMPWVVLAAGGKYVYEGPWPATVDAALELLKKYGGD